MKKENKKINLLKIVLLILLIVIIGTIIIFFITDIGQLVKIEELDVSLYYNEFVKTNKESGIYIKENEEYKKIGIISSNIELSLNEITNVEDEYFNIKGFDAQYYIHYNDVDKIEVLSAVDQRYKNYILFNKNVVTYEKTNFYDYQKNLVYSIDKGYSLPIIIKEDDIYGVEFNNRLLYIKKDECEVIDNFNTDKKNTSGVGVLNYHFFYDDSKKEEQKDCNQVICTSKTQFKQHLDYIKENNFFTPTMKELEMYIDNKIQLPKSVVITIDDGWRVELGIQMLNEYKLNGTLFLITSYYDEKKYKSEYIELHSHTHDLHEGGQCPGGQGGGIKCLPKQQILSDLKKSREELNGSNVLCYPFYEYNSYSIDIVKEAGFTMAFAGEKRNSDNLVKVGSDKYRLPRFVVVDYTTMRGLINYLN